MAAPISFLIATAGQAPVLVPCLQALMEGLDTGLVREVVFYDPDPDAAIRRIAEEAGAVMTASLGEAVGRAQGSWICLLPAAVPLPEGWSGTIRPALSTLAPCVLHPGPVPFLARFRRGGIPMMPNDRSATELNLSALFRRAPHFALGHSAKQA